jgi:spore coat polysaccharide biosynthesis predicted glycosyltransferase SpsG
MKKILFRADAAPHIGIGDLISLINISKYFDEYENYFIIKNYSAAVSLVKKYKLNNCHIIDAKSSLSEEITYINNIIENNQIDILFLEITERRLSDYQGLTQKCKKVAVNFDGYILEDLDIVIDWDVEAYKFFDTSKYSNTKFLLGAKFVILPKEFYNLSNKSIKHRDFKKILIAMGGADEFDFTNKVVHSIKQINLKNIELNIIVGAGYENKVKLEENLLKSNIKYTIKQNITNMLNEYLDCDIGIGAGGLTSSEMVAAKVSTILIATYEHQIARCKYFDQQKWAKYLGYRRFDKQELKNTILNPIILDNIDIFNTQEVVNEIKKL